ncbi:putative leader peptide [Humibacillus xanthopallidus]
MTHTTDRRTRATCLWSRRHVDLSRVSSALCHS